MNEGLADARELFLEKMAHGGVFLTVGKEKPNTMTIGWGSVGEYWGMDVMTICVRPQRYTHDLLEETDEFTVSVPLDGACKEQLAFAGRASGRDTDKFSGHGITAAPGRSVSVPVVAQCGLHFECKVKMKTEMANMDKEVLARCYPRADLHTLYFAQIIDWYYTKEE